MKGVKKGEWYINNNYKHNKSETTYASKSKESVLQQVINGLANEKCRKLVQFDTLFHTLKNGRPMFEYEDHRDLFDFFNF